MQCILLVASWADRASYTGKTSYFFEAGDEHAGEAAEQMDRISRRPIDTALIRYGGQEFLPKKQTRVFDAADLLAWHFRRMYVDTMERAGTVKSNTRPLSYALTSGQEDRYSGLMLTRDLLRAHCASQPPPPNAK